MNENLKADLIDSMLAGEAARFQIHTFDVLDSTNTYLKRAGAQGEMDGTVVLADRQMAGRGRMGRTFFSPDGTGLYMSILLRRPWSARHALRLTTAAAVAVAQAIEALIGCRADIKWVNDIYLDGKKVCGILTEGSVVPGTDRLDYAVIGIGVNICPPADGFPPELEAMATALFGAESLQGARERLAADILNRLAVLLREDQASEVYREYRCRCMALGKRILVLQNGTQREAKVLDLDEEFRLAVEFENGEKSLLDSGEISIRVQ